MEHTPPTDAQRLFDLISRLPYSQLGREDLDFVHTLLTKDEYSELHKVGQSINPEEVNQRLETKRTYAFREELKGRLRAKVKNNYAAPKPLLLRPVPAYQLIAAALIPLLLVGIRSYFYEKRPAFIPAPQIVYQRTTDTVYINKAQAAGDDKRTPQEVAVHKRAVKATTADNKAQPDTLHQLQNVLPWPAEAPVALAVLSKNGFSSRNLEDDSLLAQFFVRVN